MSKGCGPYWLRGKRIKILPEDVCMFFCPCCREHDKAYETWVNKWVCDLRFYRDMKKRILTGPTHNYLGQFGVERSAKSLKFWAFVFYLGVSTPIISHISYYKGKKL